MEEKDDCQSLIGRVGEKETGTPLLKSISNEFVTPIMLVLNYMKFDTVQLVFDKLYEVI